VAATILGDANKVKYISLAAAQRFPALQGSEIDLLVSNSTYTLARDASPASTTTTARASW
jgi:general L-amino acid transport system substrate-binding protein